MRRNSWHFNKTNDNSKFSKLQKSIFILFLRITSANIVVESILWEVWSQVSHSSSHYHPPDSRMCGIISKLFPFPSPPATNLLPSSPLTTREMSSHCRLSEGKDWPWRQVPLLNADYTKSFSSTHMLPEIRFSTSDGSISQQQLFNNTGHSDYSQVYCEAA